MTQMQAQPLHKAGFSLVELVILMGVVGIALATMLPQVTESNKLAKSKSTIEKLAFIEKAMASYAAKEGGLPCPAPYGVAVDAAGFGVGAAIVTGTPNTCTLPAAQQGHQTPGDTGTPPIAAYGAVPTKTLNIADEYAFDQWGRYIDYHVSLNAVGASIPDAGDLTIMDEPDDANLPSTTITSDGLYALVSHGVNGHGARAPNGTAMNNGSSNLSERQNSPLVSGDAYASTIAKGVHVPHSNALARYDDIVAYGDVDFFESLLPPGEIGKSNVYCWGTNINGTFGNGTLTSATQGRPANLPKGVTSYEKVIAGDYSVFAYGNDGKPYAWGRTGPGSFSRIGVGYTTGGNIRENCNGANDCIPIPTAMPLPPGVSRIKDITRLSLIGNNNRLYKWGGGWQGALGDGGSVSISYGKNAADLPIVQPAGTLYFKENNGPCALANNGMIYCWGGNGSGNLGNSSAWGGTTSTPVQVTLPAGVSYWTQQSGRCGLANDGRMFCWGENTGGTGSSYGNGEDPTTRSGTSVPIPVNMPAGETHFVYINGNEQSTRCAIASSGKTYCWGDNSWGRVDPANPTTDALVPIELIHTGIPNFKKVEVGGYASCGLTITNEAYCWGRRANMGAGSHTGNGTPTPPMKVTFQGGVYKVKDISVANFHSCALIELPD